MRIDFKQLSAELLCKKNCPGKTFENKDNFMPGKLQDD